MDPHEILRDSQQTLQRWLSSIENSTWNLSIAGQFNEIVIQNCAPSTVFTDVISLRRSQSSSEQSFPESPGNAQGEGSIEHVPADTSNIEKKFDRIMSPAESIQFAREAVSSAGTLSLANTDVDNAIPPASAPIKPERRFLNDFAPSTHTSAISLTQTSTALQPQEHALIHEPAQLLSQEISWPPGYKNTTTPLPTSLTYEVLNDPRLNDVIATEGWFTPPELLTQINGSGSLVSLLQSDGYIGPASPNYSVPYKSSLTQRIMRYGALTLTRLDEVVAMGNPELHKPSKEASPDSPAVLSVYVVSNPRNLFLESASRRPEDDEAFGEVANGIFRPLPGVRTKPDRARAAGELAPLVAAMRPERQIDECVCFIGECRSHQTTSQYWPSMPKPFHYNCYAYYMNRLLKLCIAPEPDNLAISQASQDLNTFVMTCNAGKQAKRNAAGGYAIALLALDVPAPDQFYGIYPETNAKRDVALIGALAIFSSSYTNAVASRLKELKFLVVLKDLWRKGHLVPSDARLANMSAKPFATWTYGFPLSQNDILELCDAIRQQEKPYHQGTWIHIHKLFLFLLGHILIHTPIAAALAVATDVSPELVRLNLVVLSKVHDLLAFLVRTHLMQCYLYHQGQRITNNVAQVKQMVEQDLQRIAAKPGKKMGERLFRDATSLLGINDMVKQQSDGKPSPLSEAITDYLEPALVAQQLEDDASRLDFESYISQSATARDFNSFKIQNHRQYRWLKARTSEEVINALGFLHYIDQLEHLHCFRDYLIAEARRLKKEEGLEMILGLVCIGAKWDCGQSEASGITIQRIQNHSREVILDAEYFTRLSKSVRRDPADLLREYQLGIVPFTGSKHCEQILFINALLRFMMATWRLKSASPEPFSFTQSMLLDFLRQFSFGVSKLCCPTCAAFFTAFGMGVPSAHSRIFAVACSASTPCVVVKAVLAFLDGLADSGIENYNKGHKPHDRSSDATSGTSWDTLDRDPKDPELVPEAVTPWLSDPSSLSEKEAVSISIDFLALSRPHTQDLMIAASKLL